MVSASYQIGAINNLVHVALASGLRMSLDEVRAMWRDIRAACAARGMRHVLIEGEQPQERTPSADEVLLHAAHVADGPDPLRIALCLHDYRADELTQQFVTGANRGRCSVQVFDELGPALRWLSA
ncbi:MAG: hypothetical protein AB7I32_15695 [Gammaproteobacteria bacterium]